MLISSYSNKYIEAGCDEAGRGCLAGPVFAAAVILPEDYQHELLNDSKKLSKRNRDLLRSEIENVALAYAVATCSPEEIDRINILNASFLAMHRAIEQLKTKPELLLIDGNRFKPYQNIPHHCMIKGDGRFLSIAAASILAKTYRDEYMFNLHQKFPHFAWNKNKGYPTLEHKLAIKEFGLTEHHRKTFRSQIQLKLDFET
jgi:ribonuclease HII